MNKKAPLVGAFLLVIFHIYYLFLQQKTMMNQDFSFDKSKRLLKPNEFKAVFDCPNKKIHSEHCLLFVKINGGDTPRLGLAITKKKLKLAVMRNQLKRITREVFRQKQQQMCGVDVVLIVKKSYTKESEIYDEIVKIFDIVVCKYPARSSSD